MAHKIELEVSDEQLADFEKYMKGEFSEITSIKKPLLALQMLLQDELNHLDTYAMHVSGESSYNLDEVYQEEALVDNLFDHTLERE